MLGHPYTYLYTMLKNPKTKILTKMDKNTGIYGCHFCAAKKEKPGTSISAKEIQKAQKEAREEAFIQRLL